MKLKYQKPEIETIKIANEQLLAASMEWSPNGTKSINVFEEGSDGDLSDDDLG